MKIVYFSAPWCGPCKMLGPVMDQIANSGIPVEKINIDENHELPAKYGVRSIPTLIKFNDAGEPVATSLGYKSFEQIKQWYNG